jgi:hypothetical protein
MKRRFWAAGEVKLLRSLYPDMRTDAISARLGRALNTVYAKASALGLRKSAAYLAGPEACRLRRGGGIGEQFRFRPGHVPMNKGIKGWQAGGRAILTQFKPGNRSKRWDPDAYAVGALRVTSDGYIDMKVAEGSRSWKRLHVILWEDAHGEIPGGHVLRFKDGDALNVELSNVELLSRADLMRRNTIHNLPAELRSSIQLLGQLKMRIHEKQDRRLTQSLVCDARGPA